MVLGYRAKNVPADICCIMVEQFNGHNVCSPVSGVHFDAKVSEIVLVRFSAIWRSSVIVIF